MARISFCLSLVMAGLSAVLMAGCGDKSIPAPDLETEDTAIPPIDASQPTKTETATFALG